MLEHNDFIIHLSSSQIPNTDSPVSCYRRIHTTTQKSMQPWENRTPKSPVCLTPPKVRLREEKAKPRRTCDETHPCCTLALCRANSLRTPPDSRLLLVEQKTHAHCQVVFTVTDNLALATAFIET